MKGKIPKNPVDLEMLSTEEKAWSGEPSFRTEPSKIAFKLAASLRGGKEVRGFDSKFSRKILLKTSDYLGGSEIAYQVNENGSIDLFSQDRENKTSIEARLDRPFGHTHPRGSSIRKNLVPSVQDFRTLAFKIREGGRQISDHIHTYSPKGEEITFAYTIRSNGFGQVWYSLPGGRKKTILTRVDEESLCKVHEAIEDLLS